MALGLSLRLAKMFLRSNTHLVFRIDRSCAECGKYCKYHELFNSVRARIDIRADNNGLRLATCGTPISAPLPMRN